MTYFLCALLPRYEWSSQRKCWGEVNLTRRRFYSVRTVSEQKKKGSYLFDLCFFDFLQGNSDPFCFQFGCLFLLDKNHRTGDPGITHKMWKPWASPSCVSPAFEKALSSRLHQIVSSLARILNAEASGMMSQWHQAQYQFFCAPITYLPPPTRCHHFHSALCDWSPYAG